MKILEFKRSGIGIIAEFRHIPNGFLYQVANEGPPAKMLPLMFHVAGTRAVIGSWP
jgi:hypothetical protein